MSTEETRVTPYVPPVPSGYNNRLTPRTNRFIDHWLKTGNGTASCRLAGWTGNDNSLAVTANRLLRTYKVATEIDRRLGRAVASAEEVLIGLTNHARGDLAEVLEEDGTFNLRSARRRGVSKLLKKLKVKTRYETDAEGNVTPVTEQEFELHDAQAAMVHLGRVHGLFIERTQNVNLEIIAEIKSETVLDLLLNAINGAE